MIRRAEENGFKAIVLGIDEPLERLKRESDFSWFEISQVNFNGPEEESMDPDQSWDDVAWLKSQTSLPVVVKGLLDASQVKDAHEAGVDAIFVSNQGGRYV